MVCFVVSTRVTNTLWKQLLYCTYILLVYMELQLVFIVQLDMYTIYTGVVAAVNECIKQNTQAQITEVDKTAKQQQKF